MNTVPVCKTCGSPLVEVTEQMSINIPHHYSEENGSYDSTICVISRNTRMYLACVEEGCGYETVAVEEWGEVERDKLLELYDKIGADDEDALMWLKKRTNKETT